MEANTSSTSETSGDPGPGSGRVAATAAIIDALNDSLSRIVATLEPRSVPLTLAPELLDAFCRLARTAEAGRMLIAARAAAAEEWKREGYASPADWLANKQGSSTGRARAELGASEQLGDLDATADALRDGRLSPEEAGVVTDAATVNPDAERDLIEFTEHESLRRSKQEADRRKAEVESEEAKRRREERIRKNRSVRTWTKDGAGHVHAVGPAAEIAKLAAALDREIAERFRTATPDNRDSRDAYAFDALISLTTSGGGVAVGDGAGRPKRVQLTSLAMIRVDLHTLINGFVSEGDVCEIAGVGPISVAEARRLLGESLLYLVMTNGTPVVDVVSLNRAPSLRQKLALLWEQPICSIRGCNRTVAIEYDHVVDWADTHHTTTRQLRRVCSHHHDLKTYDGWTTNPPEPPTADPPGGPSRRGSPPRATMSPPVGQRPRRQPKPPRRKRAATARQPNAARARPEANAPPAPAGEPEPAGPARGPAQAGLFDSP